jgi:predicted RNase H-like nuclease (RuvC/YqgF family)
MSRMFHTMRAWVLLPVLLASGCAMMVPPEEDPLYIKQTELDSRVARVERVIDSEGLVNLLKQIEELQKDNQGLREQVDQLQFKLDQAGTAQKQQYLDADQRLQNLEKALAAPTGPTTRRPSSC